MHAPAEVYFNHGVGTCSHCHEPFDRDPCNDYMVTREVWQQVHPEGRKGFLHDHCLAARAESKGITLTADSFTSCLCYVNRHIHLPRPVDMMQHLVKYFADDRPEAQNRPRPHFGYVVAHTMQRIADGDLLVAQPGRTPSVFQHLFLSEAKRLGTERLPE
jgi:hypothetical protein